MFARNERVVCVFDSEPGPFVLVLVGATIVGSMATVWHGVVNPPRPQQLREWRYDRGLVALKQGGQMGRFLLGCTLVLLLPRVPVAFSAARAAERPVRRGKKMGVREDRRVP